MQQSYTKSPRAATLNCIKYCSCKLSRLALTKTPACKLVSNAFSKAECGQRQLSVRVKCTDWGCRRANCARVRGCCCCCCFLINCFIYHMNWNDTCKEETRRCCDCIYYCKLIFLRCKRVFPPRLCQHTIQLWWRFTVKEEKKNCTHDFRGLWMTVAIFLLDCNEIFQISV